jgi:prepilin-type N-terminal cleavage/methylation domain-containing protein
MTRATRRHGFTVLEILIVVVVILILGTVILPTITAFWADGRTKAAVDSTQTRLAEARSNAINHGRNYQLLASPDGRQIRVSADPSEQVEAGDDGATAAEFSITVTLPETVTLVPQTLADSGASANTSGWTLLVTYKPDGTCVEDNVEFSINEPGVTPQVFRIRGMTGTVAVNRQGDPNAQPLGNR